MAKINYLQVRIDLFYLFTTSFHLFVEMSSFVFEQVDYRNLANALMYENQVNCWREKQRESSYLVRTLLRKTFSRISGSSQFRFPVN